jgi:DnaD/phage-associated family protein
MLLEALDCLEAKNILEYKYERADTAEHKGANMDKIASLIGNICSNMNNMSEYKEPEATQEKLEFDRIYRLGKERANAQNKKEPEAPRIIESAHEEEPVKFEKIEEIKEEIKKVKFENSELLDNININDIKSEINPDEKSGGAAVGMICEELEKNMDFRELYEDVQRRLQVIINPHELEIIFNLYKKMEPALLLRIAEYCGENSKSVKTVVNYFERTALGLCDDGIVTSAQYDDYIENARKISGYETKIRKMFGLGDRKLTHKERGFIKTWAIEYNFSDEMIMEGFNKAINVDKATIPYINAIYLSWHEKGFKSVEDVKNEFCEFNNKSRARKPEAGFNSEQFFEKLVRKSLKF